MKCKFNCPRIYQSQSSSDLVSGFVIEDSAWIVVDPVFNPLELPLCHLSDVGPLWDEAPKQSVSVLIATSFPTAVRMGIIDLVAFSRLLNRLAVQKLDLYAFLDPFVRSNLDVVLALL